MTATTTRPLTTRTETIGSLTARTLKTRPRWTDQIQPLVACSLPTPDLSWPPSAHTLPLTEPPDPAALMILRVGKAFTATVNVVGKAQSPTLGVKV